MLLTAKLAVPRPDMAVIEMPVFKQVFQSPASLFVAPEDYLLTECLAATIREEESGAAWLRLGPEDCDPATLLLSLIIAARRIQPDAGKLAVASMRERLGPVYGWEPLFTGLAEELSEALPRKSILVIENLEAISHAPVIGLFCAHFVTRLQEQVPCVLISHQPLPRIPLNSHAALHSVRELLLDQNETSRFLRRTGAGMSDSSIRHAVELFGGRPSALVSLMGACSLLGASAVCRELARTASLEDLYTHIALARFHQIDEASLRALGFSLRLGYIHPSILPSALGDVLPAEGPWLQSLSDGWSGVRGIWKQPLHSALPPGLEPGSSDLLHAADSMARQDAQIQAVNLYFDLNDLPRAAQAVAQICESMIDLGQWQTLQAWMRRIPNHLLHEWPWLVYLKGRITLAQASYKPARQIFSLAYDLFSQRQETEGMCLSLLAQSALDSYHNDYNAARERALASYGLAQKANLGRYQGWSGWQLGCIAIANGNLDEALAWFNPDAIANSSTDPAVNEMLASAQKIIFAHRESSRQVDYLQEALKNAEFASGELFTRLQGLIHSPPINEKTALDLYGWARFPLTLSSIHALPPASPLKDASPARLLQSLMDIFKFHLGSSPRPLGLTLLVPDIPPEPLPAPDRAAVQFPNEDRSSIPSPPDRPVERDDILKEFNPGQEMSLPRIDLPEGILDAPPRFPAFQDRGEMAHQEPFPTLSVYLLGSFQVFIDRSEFTAWPHGRGKALFKYLVAHRHKAASREILMETFWPGLDPASARNNLNVVLHGLRNAFQGLTKYPLVFYQSGAYQLNPSLRFRVDVETFEASIQEGRRLEEGGSIAAAKAQYQLAVDLYRGDFLADDPYEEWPVLNRERFRLAYMETLDRLSQVFFNEKEYPSCLNLCHLILSQDNCREDAHCRVMRCYNRLGQDHLALRQYQTCQEALKTELDVSPAPSTALLYEKIRNHEEI